MHQESEFKFLCFLQKYWTISVDQTIKQIKDHSWIAVKHRLLMESRKYMKIINSVFPLSINPKTLGSSLQTKWFFSRVTHQLSCCRNGTLIFGMAVLLLFFLNWQVYKALNFQRSRFLLCTTINYTTMHHHFEKILFKSVCTANFSLPHIHANTTHW